MAITYKTPEQIKKLVLGELYVQFDDYLEQDEILLKSRLAPNQVLRVRVLSATGDACLPFDAGPTAKLSGRVERAHAEGEILTP